MNISSKFDYRNAELTIKSKHAEAYKQVERVLSDSGRHLILASRKGTSQRDLSMQIQNMFVEADSKWRKEQRCFSVEGLKYDLLHSNLPIEIEIGHQRLVYADFFKFMSDYSNGHIHAAIMIVTHSPENFGHDWHCSVQSTKRKIESISKIYMVPTLLIGIDP